ncbi:Ig-like domain-containing protein [Herbiconiux sp. 11R-BC]|uniref:Ig-like domain-containing protein n=1 Tax=Herbiconiux sp. 11R-BC TaxID=3111637 RepID=UPI003C052E69
MTDRARTAGWLRSHRSLAITVAASGVVAALVAVVAVVSTGYTARQVHLDDAAVWVTSDLHQAAGRANPQLGELNTAVRMQSGSLAVSQLGQTVVVSDLGGGQARILNTADASVADTVPLPVGDVGIALTDSRAVITSRTTGDVWITTPGALATFDPSSPPDLTLGAGGDTAITAAGSIVAVSVATGSVFTVNPSAAAGASASTPISVDAGADVSISAVGERWVVLDRSTRRLITAEGAIDLSGSMNPVAAAGTGAWLQSASDASPRVLLATSEALLAVTLADGSVEPLSSGHTGSAARPVQVGGCWYAGWTDGRSWSACGEPGTDGGGAAADPAAVTVGTAGATGVTTAPATGAEGTLSGAASGDELVFRTNGGGGVLLSDAVTGRSWDVTRQNAPIDNWEALLPDTTSNQQSSSAVTDEPVQADPTQRPPVAVDDQLGARTGRSTVLPVLLNDYDPNGDVIVIDSVRVPDGVDWSVALISDDQQLQLTLPATATGELAIGYTISDGRGGTAEATAHVAVRAPTENSPPVQASKPGIDVALGGRQSTDIRSSWYDPDGDAFFVQSAGVAAPDVVTYTPDGVITYSDAGQSTGPKEIAVTVSDGQASTAGSIGVVVHQPGEVPLVASGFVVLVHVGQEVDVSPLPHVAGGSSALRLANVPAHDGFTIAPDYAGGTVRITAQTAGSESLDYAVADGARTASGVIRVIATQPPDANTRPVTVPHSAFARQNASVLVDVLAGDFDPAGGVLIVSGVTGVNPLDGVRVEIIEQRLIRVTLTRPLDLGRITFGYTVTNGLSDAQGFVTVVQIPDPASRQPPVAVPDTASVRVGDVVDIPVLRNDVHPDGDPLTLDPVLVQGPGADAGLLFVSGNLLRYLAPSTPGDFTAVYRVDAPDGQWATAQVTISVREADPTANAAPVPAQVTARVIAGETVHIPITLTGIDPDGDSVQFLGIDSAPGKGTVVATGADSIDYQAGDYSTGTDSFSYTVVDRLGARATGTIRVGISARLDGARNPVATPDEAQVRPGKTVLVRVLDNDSDPDGSPLTVTDVTPVTPGATASVSDNMLSIAAPATPGRYGFIYSIANGRGGTSSSFATIDVQPDAPLSRPRVSDTVLTLTDILDKKTVDVSVLDNVFFAEGPTSSLWLSVLPSYSQVARVVGGRIQVDVLPGRQVIPFTVAHPDDPNIRSSGFIWVPGTDDALPQVRAGAPKLSVQSGATLSIPINDFVVAVGGRQVTITDPNTVRATHADGGSLVADDRTVVFRSADKYFGPASVSFEVTDGSRTATLVLPITVTPRDNQPPVFNGAMIEFEPGQQKVIDLSRLTSAPGGGAQLGYQLLDPKPAGFSAVLLGSSLTISVDVGTKKGTTGAFSIGVSDGANPGKAGRIEMSVVPSTKPLAVPATDAVVAPRGKTTSVDVLANDDATNPFPGKPLTVIAVRGADAGSLPTGVTVVPSADKSVLQITVAADAPPADVSVQYQVLDGTGDPERATWGTVRIAVQDRPGPVTGLSVTGFGDRTMTVAFSPGPANNAPLQGFDVTAATPAGASVTTRCSGTACVVGTPGNGPGNAVTLSVVAINSIGASDRVSYPVPVWSDLLPSAPGVLTLVPRDGALGVSWAASTVPSGGSPVRQYDVSVGGRVVATVDASGSGCTASGCSALVGGLANGTSTTVTVTARNGAYPSLSAWPSVSGAGTPYGAPAASPVSAVANLGSGLGSVTVSWPAFAGNGDAVAGYFAQLLAPGVTSVPGGAQACSVSSPAPGTVSPPRAGGDVAAQLALGGDARSATFSGLDQVDQSYSFVVWGYNAAGCVASAVTTAVASPSPGKVDAGGVSMTMVPSGKTVDVRVDSAPTPSAPSANVRYAVRPVDGGGSPTGARQSFTLGGFPRELTDGAFGERYRFIIQACNVWGSTEVCGPWSDPVTAPEPSLTFAFDSEPVYDGTAWGWLADPPNGTLTPRYSCGTGTPPAEPGGTGGVVGANSCTPDAPAPRGSSWLDLTIGAYHFVYRG